MRCSADLRRRCFFSLSPNSLFFIRPLRRSFRHRHAGRLGNSAVDADFKGRTRFQRFGFPRSRLRLHRRIGRIPAVSAFFRPETRAWRERLCYSGCLNAAVGIWGTWLLLPLIKKNVTLLRVKGFVIIILLLIAFIKADTLTSLAEDALFTDNIIYAKSSSYQRIIVTKGKTGYSLFLNGNLQFNSFDEYRYHEALVHPAFAAFGANPKRVLVLGGGDGLALREILKYPSVEFIQLVDLDPEMTTISKHVPALGELNRHSFDDPKVHVANADAFVWLDSNRNGTL